jgi:hypothetical protein
MPQKRLLEELKQTASELKELALQKTLDLKKAKELIQKSQEIKTKLTPPPNDKRQGIQSSSH